MIDTLPAAHVAGALLTAAGAATTLRYGLIRAQPRGRGLARRRGPVGPKMTPGLVMGLLMLFGAGLCWYVLPQGPPVSASGWFILVLGGIFVAGVGAEPMAWVRRALQPVDSGWRFLMALGLVLLQRLLGDRR